MAHFRYFIPSPLRQGAGSNTFEIDISNKELCEYIHLQRMRITFADRCRRSEIVKNINITKPSFTATYTVQTQCIGHVHRCVVLVFSVVKSWFLLGSWNSFIHTVQRNTICPRYGVNDVTLKDTVAIGPYTTYDIKTRETAIHVHILQNVLQF